MIKESFIESASNYLHGMKRYARYDSGTLKDLFLLSIIGTLKDWACWYDLSDCEYKHLEELQKCIILNNSDLTLYEVPKNVYTNVNTPQTDFSWRENYNPNHIDTFDSWHILFEDGIHIDFETIDRVTQEEGTRNG